MSRLLHALKAQPDASIRLVDPQQIRRRYKYWRWRIMATSIVGYALYYFVRSNLGVPLKAMGSELGYSKEKLGLITITAGGLAYGVSKLINGFLGDRANPRYFMAIGLAASAVMNVFFGMSSGLFALATFWVANNWFQGMGFPPCARNMGYWYSPKERGTTFGIWHSSHMIGGAIISALTGYLVRSYGWRSCFFVPAGIAGIGAVIILIFLRDTPGSLGLPPVEIYKGEETQADLNREIEAGEGYWRVCVDYIFKNPYMWIISTANLLVYVLRDVCMQWGPTFLQEMKGMSVVSAGWLGTGLELAGLVSALIGGIIADRVFGGRAGRVCAIAMLLMCGVVFWFWKTPAHATKLAGTLYVAMGFLLYIPQMLIAAMAMNLATKRAAAAAVGMTGIFGYASRAISGWGLGKTVDLHGWDSAFVLMIACAAGTLVLMLCTWNVGAHPEAVEEKRGFEVGPVQETVNESA